MRDALCQFEAQVVEVRDGLTDLYVEHRGAGPSLRMPRGEVIGGVKSAWCDRSPHTEEV